MSPANRAELKTLADKSGQFISIYADAIPNAVLLIQDQDLAIPAQTTLQLGTQNRLVRRTWRRRARPK